MNGSTKRPYEEDNAPVKRAKQEDSSFSNLLKKVGTHASSSTTESSLDSKRLRMQERVVAANLKTEELKGSSVGEDTF